MELSMGGKGLQAVCSRFRDGGRPRRYVLTDTEARENTSLVRHHHRRRRLPGQR